MDRADIEKWVESNSVGLMPETPLGFEEIKHVSMCMEHIYKWYTEDYPLGNFLTAVVRNDFCEACFKADGVNRKALYLYALFLANKIGYDYREKAGSSTNKRG